MDMLLALLSIAIWLYVAVNVLGGGLMFFMCATDFSFEHIITETFTSSKIIKDDMFENKKLAAKVLIGLPVPCLAVWIHVLIAEFRSKRIAKRQYACSCCDYARKCYLKDKKIIKIDKPHEYTVNTLADINGFCRSAKWKRNKDIEFKGLGIQFVSNLLESKRIVKYRKKPYEVHGVRMLFKKKAFRIKAVGEKKRNKSFWVNPIDIKESFADKMRRKLNK